MNKQIQDYYDDRNHDSFEIDFEYRNNMQYQNGTDSLLDLLDEYLPNSTRLDYRLLRPKQLELF